MHCMHPICNVVDIGRFRPRILWCHGHHPPTAGCLSNPRVESPPTMYGAFETSRKARHSGESQRGGREATDKVWPETHRLYVDFVWLEAVVIVCRRLGILRFTAKLCWLGSALFPIAPDQHWRAKPRDTLKVGAVHVQWSHHVGSAEFGDNQDEKLGWKKKKKNHHQSYLGPYNGSLSLVNAYKIRIYSVCAYVPSAEFGLMWECMDSSSACSRIAQDGGINLVSSTRAATTWSSSPLSTRESEK